MAMPQDEVIQFIRNVLDAARERTLAREIYEHVLELLISIENYGVAELLITAWEEGRQQRTAQEMLQEIVSAIQNRSLPEREFYRNMNTVTDAGQVEVAAMLLETWRNHCETVPMPEGLQPLTYDSPWPAPWLTDLPTILTWHRSGPPMHTGSKRPFKPSTNLGWRVHEDFIQDRFAQTPHPAFVLECPEALVYKGPDYVLNKSGSEYALLNHAMVDSIAAFCGYWGITHDRSPPDSFLALRGSTLILDSTWSENYFHFVSDTVSRLHHFYHYGYTLHDVDRILVASQPSAVKWQWFNHLGIADKIMVAPPCFLQCERLLIPSLPEGGLTVEIMEFLRKGFQLSPQTGKRIFVARGQARNGRRMINEKLFFERFLQPHGFMWIVADTLDMYEQAEIFSSASTIVAPHGGALMNLAFATPGSKILELFGSGYINSCMLHIGNQIGLDHYHLIGRDVSQQGDLSDYLLDLDAWDVQKIL
ncbi:MAG: glycosyltransferase family 61 protein [Magnetococcales bacterium]|nr:glycosyltransferase family 61 protein [Magnetococcales bacterium]